MIKSGTETFLSTGKIPGEVNTMELRVDVITSEGLGAGVGNIGVKSRVENVNDPLTLEIVELVNNTVQTDPNILVNVDVDKDNNPLDDDGCGDGRGVVAVFEGLRVRKKSLNRSKVFGSTVVMTTSAFIGLGKGLGRSLNDLTTTSVNWLKEKKIGFGGHTDHKVHEDGNASGCGAIDKAPQHVKVVAENRDYIEAGLAGLGADTTYLEEVFGNFEAYYRNEVAGSEAEYSGKKVITENLTQNEKVVKELEPEHREIAVILNSVEGTTVNQEYIRKITDGAAQVFAVDVWRLSSIAKRAFEDVKDQEVAYLSMLVHTLAVAYNLTEGDLPIYHISAA